MIHRKFFCCSSQQKIPGVALRAKRRQKEGSRAVRLSLRGWVELQHRDGTSSQHPGQDRTGLETGLPSRDASVCLLGSGQQHEHVCVCVCAYECVIVCLPVPGVWAQCSAVWLCPLCPNSAALHIHLLVSSQSMPSSLCLHFTCFIIPFTL